MSGGDGSREEAKKLEDEKPKGQLDRAMESVSGEPDGSQRHRGHGRSLFDALRSFGRSDSGGRWTSRRSVGFAPAGGSSVCGAVESDHIGRGDRERDLEKGEVCRTEVVHGSESASASASASASFRQVDKRDSRAKKV